MFRALKKVLSITLEGQHFVPELFHNQFLQCIEARLPGMMYKRLIMTDFDLPLQQVYLPSFPFPAEYILPVKASGIQNRPSYSYR